MVDISQIGLFNLVGTRASRCPEYPGAPVFICINSVHGDSRGISCPTFQIQDKYIIVYYTILYYTILYCTVLYCTMLYYTVLCHSILSYIIMYSIIYYTILYAGRPQRPPRPARRPPGPRVQRVVRAATPPSGGV